MKTFFFFFLETQTFTVKWFIGVQQMQDKVSFQKFFNIFICYKKKFFFSTKLLVDVTSPDKRL